MGAALFSCHQISRHKSAPFSSPKASVSAGSALDPIQRPWELTLSWSHSTDPSEQHSSKNYHPIFLKKFIVCLPSDTVHLPVINFLDISLNLLPTFSHLQFWHCSLQFDFHPKHPTGMALALVTSDHSAVKSKDYMSVLSSVCHNWLILSLSSLGFYNYLLCSGFSFLFFFFGCGGVRLLFWLLLFYQAS